MDINKDYGVILNNLLIEYKKEKVIVNDQNSKV
jgi:hypothetical protein